MEFIWFVLCLHESESDIPTKKTRHHLREFLLFFFYLSIRIWRIKVLRGTPPPTTTTERTFIRVCFLLAITVVVCCCANSRCNSARITHLMCWFEWYLPLTRFVCGAKIDHNFICRHTHTLPHSHACTVRDTRTKEFQVATVATATSSVDDDDDETTAMMSIQHTLMMMLKWWNEPSHSKQLVHVHILVFVRS